MQVLEQAKGPDRFGKSGSSRGLDCEKNFDIKLDGKPSRCFLRRLPSVLKTLFFPCALSQWDTLRLSTMSLISDIYHFKGVKSTTFWLLVTKNFLGPFGISESGHLVIFHCIMIYSLLLCYTTFDFLSFYIKSCLFHLMSCSVKTWFLCLRPWR